MLTTLRIQNFAIVKELELDFNDGMTAFTGETGAGKSIMIDALLLALGEKADTQVIRKGETTCDVCASFILDDNALPRQWLAEHDVPMDDNELILRRVISTEGRTKSYINGQLFPLQKIKELSGMLVNIHGQHQHQTLMQHQAHRVLLDAYCKHPELLTTVAQLHKQLVKTQLEIEEAQSVEDNNDKIQLLKYQIEELVALNLQEDELNSLHHEHQLLSHAKDYLTTSQNITDLLDGDEVMTVSRGLHQALHLLQTLPSQDQLIINAVELINSALIHCEEANDAIQSFSEKVSLDPKRLAEVEDRMSTIHQLARKYHIEAALLYEHTRTLEAQLEKLQHNQGRLATLMRQHEKQTEEYNQAAKALHDSRINHAKSLAQEITNCIQQLGMPKGYVDIELSPLLKAQTHGLDKVEFKVCTNPGMPPDALHKIASGGELSRISLAIQMITAQRGTTPTLLFDEVDVGIGGATAALVGRFLRQLGMRLQVFCVTHQPQVAASAHTHFLVEKQVREEQTFTHIKQLATNDKVDEIARMIGGLTITAHTLSHAKELIGQVENAT